MRAAGLELLGNGVQVAEAALERMLLEDGRGTGGVIGEIADGNGFLDRLRRREPDGHALTDGESVRALNRRRAPGSQSRRNTANLSAARKAGPDIADTPDRPGPPRAPPARTSRSPHRHRFRCRGAP